jgi:hypothetical protein
MPVSTLRISLAEALVISGVRQHERPGAEREVAITRILRFS